MRIGTMIVWLAAAGTAGASDWTLSTGASGWAGDTSWRAGGSASVRRDFHPGGWDVAPILTWNGTSEQPSDSAWQRVYPEIQVSKGLGDLWTLVFDGWMDPLATTLDYGGSGEVDFSIEPLKPLRLGASLDAGWSNSSQAYGQFRGEVEVVPAEGWSLQVGSGCEVGQMAAGGGKNSSESYLPRYFLDATGGVELGPVTFGPDARWGWYSMERGGGGGMGRSGTGSSSQITTTHDDWSAGAHASARLSDAWTISGWALRTWSSDQTTTRSDPNATMPGGKSGRSPGADAAGLVEEGVTWGLTTTWEW